MTGLAPILIFVVIGALAVAWFIQSQRLFYIFRAKYPDVATREMPQAFSIYPHPEKLFFFFRQKSQDVLKANPSIWKLRQQVFFLTVCLFIIFPALFLAFWLIMLVGLK